MRGRTTATLALLLALTGCAGTDEPDGPDPSHDASHDPSHTETPSSTDEPADLPSGGPVDDPFGATRSRDTRLTIGGSMAP